MLNQGITVSNIHELYLIGPIPPALQWHYFLGKVKLGLYKGQSKEFSNTEESGPALRGAWMTESGLTKYIIQYFTTITLHYEPMSL